VNDNFFWRELGLEPGTDRKQIKMIALNEAYAYLMGTLRVEGFNAAGFHAAGQTAFRHPAAGSAASRNPHESAYSDRRHSQPGGDGQAGPGDLKFDTSWSGPGATGVAEPAADRTDLGFHKDPSYAYYKQGFVHFSRAIHGIEALYQSLSQRRVVHFKPRDDAYQRFAEGLVELRRAHEYFSRVVQEFDSSIWKHDARMKLRRIERFTGLYRRILGNLTSAG